VAQAVPDGHTLLVSNIASHGVAPSLYRGLRYDAVRDFTHIALVVENPLIFVATPRFPATTLADVVRLSREDTRGIDIASSGSGSTNHLLILQFGQATGAQVNHVPYRGMPPAVTDLVAGHIPVLITTMPSAAGVVREGRVRLLAYTAPGAPDQLP
jgi:tripartite-type tricarboxylate transporter receptor subunit TctC